VIIINEERLLAGKRIGPRSTISSASLSFTYRANSPGWLVQSCPVHRLYLHPHPTDDIRMPLSQPATASASGNQQRQSRKRSAMEAQHGARAIKERTWAPKALQSRCLSGCSSLLSASPLSLLRLSVSSLSRLLLLRRCAARGLARSHPRPYRRLQLRWLSVDSYVGLVRVSVLVETRRACVRERERERARVVRTPPAHAHTSKPPRESCARSVAH